MFYFALSQYLLITLLNPCYFFFFRHVGNRLHEVKHQIGKAKNIIQEDRLSYSDVLLAVVFFTIDSDPVNNVMRVLWAEIKFSNFNDKEKFSIAACVLTKSYILEKKFSFIKWNITKMKLPTENVMPFQRPYSVSDKEQSQFGHYKTFLKSLVGSNLGDSFFYRKPKFYSLWGSLERP